MSQIERSDLSGDQWRWSESERVSPDDPIIHGLRWLEERDLARAQLKKAVEALGDAYSALTDGEGLGPDVSEEAVEQARDVLAAALIAVRGSSR